MSQQYEERQQDRFEADEGNDYLLASSQSRFSAQRSGLFIELRFAVALFSVITLLAMSVVNMVIERLLETALYGLGPYFPSVSRLLFFTLPSLGMTILLTALLVWINRFVGRRTRNTSFSNPFGEKLFVSQPPSIGQRLGLAFISVGLVASLWLTATMYLRFGPYLSDVLLEVTTARLAAIPVFTATLLVGAALWINIIFNRRQP